MQLLEVQLPGLNASEQKETIPHHNYEIRNLNLLDPSEIRSAAHVYFDAWHPLDLCTDENEAIAKIVNFSAKDTYLLRDTDNKQILAVLNTLPVIAKNVSELVTNFPTYRSVEEESVLRNTKRQINPPNFIICFSIAAKEEGKHRIIAGSQKVPPSKYLLENFQKPGTVRKLAYSRVKGPVGEETLEQFYYRCALEESNLPLGAVGMHKKYGAIPIAFLTGSREEDVNGGGGNILMVYPQNGEEAGSFRFADESRIIRKRDGNPIPCVKAGSHIVYTDIDIM